MTPPEADHLGGRGLRWSGCLNARDLGGLPAADGRRIRRGVLIRSDSPHMLTDSGAEDVRSAGVRRILDLRSLGEVERDPSPFAGDPAYQLIPLIDPDREDERDSEAERTRAEAYIGSLRRNAGRIAAGLAVIADAPEGAVLVHCHEGKDRTGMVVALALRVAGVEPEVIAADYAASADCLRERYEDALAALTTADEREELRELQKTEPETMLAFLRALEEQHGGAVAYLSMHGLNRGQLTRLRQRLLEPAR